MAWLITLYVVAGLLEALGIWLAVLELRDASKRLRSYKMLPRVVDLRAAPETETVFPVTVRVDPLPPLETRVQVVEDAVRQHREQRAEDLAQLKDYARKEASGAIDYVQKSVDRELTRVIDLVFALNDPDRRGWRRWPRVPNPSKGGAAVKKANRSGSDLYDPDTGPGTDLRARACLEPPAQPGEPGNCRESASMGIDPDQVLRGPARARSPCENAPQRHTHVLAATRIRPPTSPQRLTGLPAIHRAAITAPRPGGLAICDATKSSATRTPSRRSACPD